MSERFTRLFALQENQYAAGAPVVISAGALLKDNQTGKVLAQLKLQNIDQRTIKAATVSVYPLDTSGDPLGEAVCHQYLDLSAERDTDFGQKSAIALPDATTRAFTVAVDRVVFSDNSNWNSVGAAWEPLSAPKPLSDLGDSELIKQFHIEYGSNCKNLPLEQKDLWHCSCSALNHTHEEQCHRCGQTLFALQTIDMQELQKTMTARLAAEKAQAEKETRL